MPMNVIPSPTPRRSAPPARAISDSDETLFLIVAAIRELGEPATLAEIGDLLLSLGAIRAQYEAAGLSSILAEYSRPIAAPPFDFPLFWAAQVGGVTARARSLSPP